MKRWSYLLLFSFFILRGITQPVNTLVYNATIYTVDDTFSKAEAMVIHHGKIMAIGKTDSLIQQFSINQKIDAGGKFIYPGFIDAHCHFVGYGKSLQECNLTGTRSWQEALQRLKNFSLTHSDGWLIGRGWDQNDWTDKIFPTNDSLNALFAGRPVFLTRIDGHAAIVNQKALDLAGIDSPQTPEGGEMVTNNGKLTGVLMDNAIALIEEKIPVSTAADFTKYIHDAAEKCFAVGLTGVQDCGLDAMHVKLIRQLYAANKLSIRMSIFLSDKKENYDYLFAEGRVQTDQLTVNGFKLYADGALGSRGACLLHPYSDRSGHFGTLLRSKTYYDSILHVIAEKGFQACTHAIGDSANRTILGLYAKSLSANKNSLRWRIEHAQVVDPQDFHLFKDHHIIPSVQPTHATSDMYWAKDRLGTERIKGAYAYQQLLQQNGWMPLGTDFPVEDIAPLRTFFAAVVRRDASGFPNEGFQMENALSREQALRGMTIWAARAAFEDHLKGSLEKGKLADFVVLNKDLMTCNQAALLDIKILQTYVGGERVYGN